MCPAKFWMQDSEKCVPQACKRKKNDKNRIRKKNSKKKMRHNNFKILFSTKPHFRNFSQQSSTFRILHRKFTKLKIPSILRILIVEHFFETISNFFGIIFFRKIFENHIKIKSGIFCKIIQNFLGIVQIQIWELHFIPK
mgnify:CR=1 FL=1